MGITKPDLHPKKVMICIWWTIQVPLYWELLPEGQAITSDVYIAQLHKINEQAALSPLRRDKEVLLHDNARHLVIRKVAGQLTKFGWRVLLHPIYSPDLAPSDYLLFHDQQHYLEEKEFDNVKEVENELTAYFASRTAEFWKDGIHRLPERWQYVVDYDGGYC